MKSYHDDIIINNGNESKEIILFKNKEGELMCD